MTGSLFCAFCAAATLICAAGWRIEYQRHRQTLRYWEACAGSQVEAAQVIVQLTEALEAKRGRTPTLPPRLKIHVN